MSCAEISIYAEVVVFMGCASPSTETGWVRSHVERKEGEGGLVAFSHIRAWGEEPHSDQCGR